MVEKTKRRQHVFFIVIVVMLLNIACGFASKAIDEKTETPQQSAPQRSPDAVVSAPQTGDVRATNQLRKDNDGLTRADRRAWCEVLKWTDDCSEPWLDYGEGKAGLSFYELAPARYLVAVMLERGAYNPEYSYFYLDETTSSAMTQLMTLTRYNHTPIKAGKQSVVEEYVVEVPGEPSFDNQKTELTVLNKYRGIGDCGDLATYGFRDGKPVLQEFRQRGCEDNQKWIDPREWQKVEIK